jgi:hypothetical protein
MARSELDEKYELVIKVVANSLRAHGFARKGRVLRALERGNAMVIDFQRSRMGSGNRVAFTVNAGVVCGALLDAEKLDVRNASTIDAHLNTRLGAFLDPSKDDAWWEIDETTDVGSLAAELCQLCVTRVVPYLQRYASTHALVAMWETGSAVGITERQRVRYLTELKTGREPGVSGA